MIAHLPTFLPSHLPSACQGEEEGRTSYPIPLGQPSPSPARRREEATDDLMKAAAVNHSPDHVLNSLGGGKPVGPQRHSFTPTAAHIHLPWQLFLELKAGSRNPPSSL